MTFSGSVGAALAAGHFADGTVAGLRMSSTELNKPPQNLKEIFAEAEKVGIRRTAHAAEEGPAQYIADSLNILQCKVSIMDAGWSKILL